MQLDLGGGNKPNASGGLGAIPANITAGNLSALEEDDLAGRRLSPQGGAAPTSSPSPVAPPVASAPSPNSSAAMRPVVGPGPIAPVSSGSPLSSPKKSASGAIIGVLVVLVAVVAVGVAYAAHIIPH
jgi:hypothetical protein